METDKAKVEEIGSLLLIRIRHLNFIVSVKGIIEEFEDRRQHDLI